MPPVQSQIIDPSKPAVTTFQEDLTAAGQRHINSVWEYTQAAIAVLVTIAVITASLKHIQSPEITNAFFLVVGFYFSRTNHAAIGGVGVKATDSQKYEGR